jgi:RNA polymerase sporulation-specific sigma factor
LVVRIASRFTRDDDDLMELIQVGSIGLWKAAEGFDPDRGFAFSTYAYHAIRNEILRRLLPRKNQIVLDYAEPWSPLLERPDGDCPSEVEQSAMDTEEWEAVGDTRKSLMSAIGELDGIDQIVICRRFALDGGKRLSLGSLGKELCLSGERVRQRQKRAIRQLQNQLVGVD